LVRAVLKNGLLREVVRSGTQSQHKPQAFEGRFHLSKKRVILRSMQRKEGEKDEKFQYIQRHFNHRKIGNINVQHRGQSKQKLGQMAFPKRHGRQDIP